MVASERDWRLSAASTGFTVGFGILTAWTAIQQTISIKAPLKTPYLYLIWSEFISNFIIALIALLDPNMMREDKVPDFLQYFLIIIFGTLETQCYLQIIIDRASLMGPNKKLLARIKWGTALSMTILQAAVFTFWYCAKLNITPFHVILKYTDHISKAIFLAVDMLLNYWFVRVVQHYLEKKPERYEYTSLCRFQLCLIFLSLSLDCLLLGFASLRNPVLYLQSHPVAFITKLNIEMSMANLVARLTRGSDFDEDWSFIPPSAFSKREPGKILLQNNTLYHHSATLFIPNNARPVRTVVTSGSDDDITVMREGVSGMKATKDVLVTVEQYEDNGRSCKDRWNRSTRRPLSRRRSEASLSGRALRSWYSSEPSKITLDTKIFDDLPEQTQQ